MPRLTVAQALVRFLAAQYTERDGERRRLIGATWGIFGHGNVAGIGQALLDTQEIAQMSKGEVYLIAVMPPAATFMGGEGYVYDKEA